MSLPYNPRPPDNCGSCHFLHDCGGLEGEDYNRGCFRRCVEHCVAHGCDMACPCRHFDFSEMVEEAGGLWAPPTEQLISPDVLAMPPYLPEIQHGSSRQSALPEEIVAVPLSSVLRKDRKGRCYVPFSTPESFRRAFRIGDTAKVIVVSVGKDQPLEDFWQSHQSRDLIGKLSTLRLWAMTVPNFSFMRDVPRLNSILNFSRMFRVADRLTAAGIPTIFHIQAVTRFDWGRWESVLRDQSGASYVAIEFLTGTRGREFGDRYYFGLRALQEALGRPLHPVVVGGGGRIKELKKDFRSFTVVDSIPFMRTMHRRSLCLLPRGAGWRWINRTTPVAAPLDKTMAENIRNYRRRMYESVGLTGNWNSVQDLFSSVA